jgi:hypothetical protein
LVQGQYLDPESVEGRWGPVTFGIHDMAYLDRASFERVCRYLNPQAPDEHINILIIAFGHYQGEIIPVKT